MSSGILQIAHSLQTPQRFSLYRLSKYSMSSELQPQPRITTISTEHGASITNFCLKILNYEIKLVVCHLCHCAPQKVANLGTGSYGHVRRESIRQRLFAVKRQYFKRKIGPEEGQQANSHELMDILIEFGMTKICSFYQIGPEVDTDIGFDILCYSDCVQFHLEMCQKPSGSFINQMHLQSLNQVLQLMHSLRIVHRDIKPDNIMFSSRLKRLVLVDFGLSHFVKQTSESNDRSYTFYGGTRRYMSQEMLNIEETGEGYVNLYLNDVLCLAKSMLHLEDASKNRVQHIVTSIRSIHPTIKCNDFDEILDDEQMMNSRQRQFFEKLYGNNRQKPFENHLNNYQYLKLLFNFSVDDQKERHGDTTQCWFYLTKEQMRDILQMIVQNCTKHRVQRVLIQIERSGVAKMMPTLKGLLSKLEQIRDSLQYYPEQMQIKNETEQSIKYRIRIENYNDNILKRCREIKNPTRYIQSVINYISINGDTGYRYRLLPVPPKPNASQGIMEQITKFYQAYCKSQPLQKLVEYLERLPSSSHREQKDAKWFAQLSEFLLNMISLLMEDKLSAIMKHSQVLICCANIIVKTFLKPGIEPLVQKLVLHLFLSVLSFYGSTYNTINRLNIPWNLVADMTPSELILQLFQMDNLNKGFFSAAETIGLQLLRMYRTRLGERHLCTLSQQKILALLLGSRGQYKWALEIQQSRFSSIRFILNRESPEMFQSLLVLAWLHGKNNTGLDKKLHRMADSYYFCKPRSVSEQFKYISCKILSIVDCQQQIGNLRELIQTAETCRAKLDSKQRFSWTQLIWCRLYLNNPNQTSYKVMLFFCSPGECSKKDLEIQEIWKNFKTNKPTNPQQNFHKLMTAGKSGIIHITDRSIRHRLLKRIILADCQLRDRVKASDPIINTFYKQLENESSKTIYDFKEMLMVASRIILNKSRDPLWNQQKIRWLLKLGQLMKREQMDEAYLLNKVGICEVMVALSCKSSELVNDISQIIAGLMSLCQDQQIHEESILRCYDLLIGIYLKEKDYEEAFSYISICDSTQTQKIRTDFPQTIQGTYQMCRYLYATGFNDLANSLVDETTTFDRQTVRWRVLKTLNNKQVDIHTIRDILPELLTYFPEREAETIGLLDMHQLAGCCLSSALIACYKNFKAGVNPMWKLQGGKVLDSYKPQFPILSTELIHSDFEYWDLLYDGIKLIQGSPSIVQAILRVKFLARQWLMSNNTIYCNGLVMSLEQALCLYSLGQLETAMEQLVRFDMQIKKFKFEGPVPRILRHHLEKIMRPIRERLRILKGVYF